MRVAFHPGSGLAIVGPGGAGLLEARSDDPLVQVLMSALESTNPDVGHLAKRLTELGVGGLPPFGIVLNRGDEVTALVHGAVGGSIGVGDTAESLDASNVATWIERTITRGPVRLALAEADLPSGDLWIDGGIVPAGAISVSDERWKRAEGDTEPLVADASDESQASIEARESDEVDLEPLDIEPTAEETATSDEAHEDSDGPLLAVDDSEGSENEVAEFDFTHLVDHTVYRDSRDAEVRQEEPADVTGDDLASGEAEPGEPEEASLDLGPASAVTIAPDPTETTPGLIDWVPSADDQEYGRSEEGAGAEQVAAAPASSQSQGDHDGRTEARGPGGLRRQPTVPGAQSDPRLVNGVLCPQGHPNSPVADRCMICREILTDRSVRRMERPSLGRLVLPSGEIVEVDRPIVLGRMPVATELIGGEVPLTVTIDDDVVTRNHAQILIDEWHVLIVDLESTNETMVTIPGQAPRVLAPHDPCVLLPGTTIDLGGFGPVVFEGPG